MGRNHRATSDFRQKEIVDYYQQGFNSEKTAKKFKISETTVRKFLNFFKVKFHKTNHVWHPPTKNLKISDEDKIRFLGHIGYSRNCWNWTGQKFNSGYGSAWINGKCRTAHRVSYEIFNGKIKGNLLVCHKCDNKSCVKPSHLFLGTSQDNLRDASKKGLLASGKNNGMHISPTLKLNEQKVRKIRKEHNPKVFTCEMLAKKYNVSKRTIRSVLENENWKWVSP